MKRIHIVGVSPRSGTTLLAEAMKHCFEIEYATDHEDELYSRAPGNPEVFLSKCPKDIMKIEPSLKVDPHLYALCMIRDPRDILVSKHRKDPKRYWAGLKFWKLYSRQLSSLVRKSRFTLIRYEHFVTEPDRIQNLIAKRIPFLRKKAPFSKYHEVVEVSDPSKKALGGVRPIRPTSVGRWRTDKKRIAGQLKLHGSISNDLIHFGYEKDDQWVGELEGIEPDLSESHFSEHFSLKDKVLLKAGRHIEACRRIIECWIGRRIRILHPKKWVPKLMGREY